MSNPNPGAGGTNQPSGGTVANPEIKDPLMTPSAGGEGDKDTVAFDTHRKLLGEKKKIQEERDALLAEKKVAEEAKLKEQGEWKKLADLREAEAKAAKKEAADIKETLGRASKMQSFLGAIEGDIPEKFWGFIDVNKIVTNPETGQPDPVSVQAYAKEFQTNYSELIAKPVKQKLPNEAASVGGEKLTYEEWMKLPLKEQQQKLKFVIGK